MMSDTIDKGTATIILDAMKERMVSLNMMPHFNYYVGRAIVFGDYPSMKEDGYIRNIDVGIALEPKYNKGKQEEMDRKKSSACPDKDPIKIIAWPLNEVVEEIWMNSGVLSIHLMDNSQMDRMKGAVEIYKMGIQGMS